MSEPEPPVVAGIDAARNIERAERNADVEEELASIKKIADELAQHAPESSSD